MKYKFKICTKFQVGLVFLLFFTLLDLHAQSEQTILRQADFDIKLEAFNEEQLTLSFFDDAQYIANRLFVDNHPNGAISWVGKLENQEFSTVIISHSEGTIWGKVETETGQLFIIRPDNEKLEVHQLDFTPIDEECNHVEIEEIQEYDIKEKEENIQRSQVADVCLSTSTCAAQVIDLLVVYSPEARTNLGGTDAAAQAAIATAVSEMNLINVNSNVSHSFALVHAAFVSYTETGSFSTDLDNLENPEDGFIDNVHDLRDQYYADAVSMVLGSGGCGLGNANTNSVQYRSQSAFSIVSNSCMTSNKSLAHEVGHNLGFRHNRFAYSTPPSIPCSWGWGWVNPDAQTGGTAERWRTVMAYNSQCSSWGFNCTRLSYWSNPNVTYNGDPMGSAIGNVDEANIEYLFERAACQFVEFREPVGCTNCEVYQNCANYNTNTANGPGNSTVLNISGPFTTASGGASAEVCIYYHGDHSGGSEQFNVIDENGNTLGQTVASMDCGIPNRVCFNVVAATYNSWIANGTVTVTLDPISTSINPDLCTLDRACAELVLNMSSCATDLILTTAETGSMTYQVSNNISSTDLITTAETVTYDAGFCIDLNPGFEVIIGAVFEAYIGGCTSLQADSQKK